jgi:hypothetical protein
MSLNKILADITFMENVIKVERDVATQDGNLHLRISPHDSITSISQKCPLIKMSIFHSHLIEFSVTIMCGPKFYPRTFLSSIRQ